MDQLAAHRRAQDVFAGVLANVKPEQLGVRSPCTEWDAKAVIDHVIGGNQWVVSLAGGHSSALPDDLRAAHAESAADAQAVFAAPDGLTRMFELPFATLPGAGFIGMRTSDVFTHAWDLAKATGQPTDIDPELADEALKAAPKSGLAPLSADPADRLVNSNRARTVAQEQTSLLHSLAALLSEQSRLQRHEAEGRTGEV
jgi:uncharacterized protein (TIGR03086 family)